MSCSKSQSETCDISQPHTSLHDRDCQPGLLSWAVGGGGGEGQHFLCYQVLDLGPHLLSGLEAGVCTPKAFPRDPISMFFLWVPGP